MFSSFFWVVSKPAQREGQPPVLGGGRDDLQADPPPGQGPRDDPGRGGPAARRRPQARGPQRQGARFAEANPRPTYGD